MFALCPHKQKKNQISCRSAVTLGAISCRGLDCHVKNKTKNCKVHIVIGEITPSIISPTRQNEWYAKCPFIMSTANCPILFHTIFVTKSEYFKVFQICVNLTAQLCNYWVIRSSSIKGTPRQSHGQSFLDLPHE